MLGNQLRATSCKAAVVALSLSAPCPALADPAAAFLTRLFMDACLPSLGQPTQVRAWAGARKLPEIINPAALGLFVGPGQGGAAWAVPSLVGQFALSIRGDTHGCVAWARTADPAEATANFVLILEGVKRPGLDVQRGKDVYRPGASGAIHLVSYTVRATASSRGFEFLLLTSEHPGGPFQASMEVARANDD